MAVKFFDEEWYLARNPDVAEAIEGTEITAEQHFELHGMQEGRSPSPLFHSSFYLEQNPDVAEAIAGTEITAYQHFELHGHQEGRSASPYFNPDHYLDENPDVKDAVEAGNGSVYEHFQAHGQFEGRSPLASFDPAQYLAANPDVDEAVEGDLGGAVVHFMKHGVTEDRNLNSVISIAAYLAANEDVFEAVEQGHTTGLAHLMTYGVKEGRDLGHGVSADQFVNDPVYQEAIDNGDTDAALSRMADVTPFLPEFEAPEDFELPADWPIPQDFVPVEGALLTVPEGWEPAEPVQLPDYFEQPFVAEVLPGGAVAFPEATGEIMLINEDGEGSFAQGNFLAGVKVLLNGTATVELGAEQVLVGQYTDIGQLNVTGEGEVRAMGTEEADEIDASSWNAVNLTVDAGAGDDIVTIADTQTAVGGEGADTFVIAATAGVSSVITVDDYAFDEGDVIDLSQVEDFNIFAMEVRGAEHDGTEWQWGDGYDGDSVGIWFSGEAANVQVTGARHETMKFALPEIEGFEEYGTMQLNIAEGGVLRADDEAPEILRGGDGSQFFLSGEQADILSGGDGVDTFIIRDAAKSSLDSMDHILDFEIGEDVLVSHTLVTAGNFHDGGTLADLEAATIAEALTEETFQGNAGAYFMVGEGAEARTFVALNDGTAGFDAAADTLIEITGYEGDLAQLAVIGVPDLSNVAGGAQVEELLAV